MAWLDAEKLLENTTRKTFQRKLVTVRCWELDHELATNLWQCDCSCSLLGASHFLFVVLQHNRQKKKTKAELSSATLITVKEIKWWVAAILSVWIVFSISGSEVDRFVKKKKRKRGGGVISNRARFTENLPIFFFLSASPTVAAWVLSRIHSLTSALWNEFSRRLFH